MIAAALQWAAEGVPVFPVRGKVPVTEHGLNDATLAEAQIRAWWEQLHPEAGIGGAVGKACGSWVLDIDAKGDGLASLRQLERLHGPLPATRTIRTGGGGLHLWWTMPEDGRHIGNRTGVRGGIDVRGTGGYVVLPPTLHESGKRYELADDRAPVDAPPWLVDLVIKRKPTSSPGASRGPSRTGTAEDRRRVMGIVLAACERIRAASEGSRNDTVNRECFSVGGFLDAAGVSLEEVAPLLEAAAQEAEQAPGMVRRCLEDGRKHQRSMPPDQYAHAWEGYAAAAASAAAQDLEADASSERDLEADSDGDGREEPPIEVLLGEADGEQSQLKEDEQPYLVLVGASSTAWFLRRRDGAGYIPVAEKVLRIELKDRHPSLKVTTRFGDGPSRPMGPAALYARYGRRADELIYSYTGESAYRYGEEGGGTLVQRVCRPDPALSPEHSPQVEAWLKELAGDRYNLLCDWLATSMQIDQPTAALYLEGPNSSGKGMLADALARIWRGTVCDYGDVAGITSPFNSALLKSPVVWLDERAPASKNGSAAFRRLTGNRTHPIHEKHRPSATLRGCPRVIIGANNPDALRLGENEDLEREDEDAVAIRILHIRVPRSARAWLASRGGYQLTGRWVDDGDRPGALVRHIAHLAEQRQAAQSRGGRFLVEGAAGDWLQNVSRREGWPRRVLLALARAISGAQDPIEKVDRAVFFRKGEVWVRAEQLKKSWQVLTGEGRGPNDRQIGEALKMLARKPGATDEEDDGKPDRESLPELGELKNVRAWVRKIRAELILEAAIEAGIGDPDTIRSRLLLPAVEDDPTTARGRPR